MFASLSFIRLKLLKFKIAQAVNKLDIQNATFHIQVGALY